MESDNPLHETLYEKVNKSRILVVGAGGIGCELLKNLVLTGFHRLEVIDLDTIDVSNLNRQFLFQTCHVGKSKALVARESALRMAPNAEIVARHDTIFNNEYNVKYFKGFDLVLNALDNLTARNHVNRMCLAADVPLIESGSAGYMGQVMVIRKGVSECYECHPAPRRKTFPGCTIRNTPSELIHCVVWAKYLFNQLFGEEDADQDVSPDQAATKENKKDEDAASGDHKQPIKPIERVNTRKWAKNCDYNPEMVFNKLFNEDIKYLLSMDKLWKKRKAPTPMEWNKETDTKISDFNHQKMLSIEQNMALFYQSLNSLKVKLEEENAKGEEHLYWDKDDSAAMKFTAAAANIRASIFSIEQKSVFDIKAMAGNIIPAIATTNAIVAGLIVMQIFDILMDRIKECRNVLVCSAPRPNKRLLDAVNLDPPQTGCYVCSEKREVTVAVLFDSLTLLDLRDKVLKGQLGMLAPDVEILGRGGVVLMSSDEEDYDEEMMKKKLSDFQLVDGSRLLADDFLQNYNVVVNLVAPDAESPLEDEALFKMVATTSKPAEEAAESKPIEEAAESKPIEEATESKPVEEVAESKPAQAESATKRKLEEIGNGDVAKKAKIAN